jgi:hypothetical protein
MTYSFMEEIENLCGEAASELERGLKDLEKIENFFKRLRSDPELRRSYRKYGNDPPNSDDRLDFCFGTDATKIDHAACNFTSLTSLTYEYLRPFCNADGGKEANKWMDTFEKSEGLEPTN